MLLRAKESVSSPYSSSPPAMKFSCWFDCSKSNIEVRLQMRCAASVALQLPTLRATLEGQLLFTIHRIVCRVVYSIQYLPFQVVTDVFS
jgi:hypothetical protein